MFKSEFQNQFDIIDHQQQIYQRVQRQQLAQIARGQSRRIGLDTLLQLVLSLFR